MRRATPDDLPALLDMARTFHAHVKPEWPLSESKLSEVLGGLMQEQFVAVTPGGFIAGVCVDHPLSDWTVAKEFLWWAADGNGGKLRAAFRQWARERGASEIQWSCPPGARAERLYRRTARATEIIYSEFLPCA